MRIRIVTRSSKLALWQANYIADRLKAAGMDPEIVTLETIGDKILDVSISKIGSKGVFTEELEEALRTGQAEIAVHSAKDMPSELPDGFELIAFTERELPNDVLISRDPELDINSDGIVIGTSSTRRTALIRHFYPGARIQSVRGNLQTRIRKMDEGDCDVLMLAYAGVHRMGYDNMIVRTMDMDQFTPPVGQGSVTVEVHESLDHTVRDAVRKAVNHPETEICLRTERAFLKTLQGGCSIPAFGHATLRNESVFMQSGIVSLDGEQLIRKSGEVPTEHAVKLGHELAEKVLAAGGADILKKIKSENP